MVVGQKIQLGIIGLASDKILVKVIVNERHYDKQEILQ